MFLNLGFCARRLHTKELLLIGAGHTGSFNAIPLRESTKSTLLTHVLTLTHLLAGTLGIKSSPPHRVGYIKLLFEMLGRRLKP